MATELHDVEVPSTLADVDLESSEPTTQSPVHHDSMVTVRLSEPPTLSVDTRASILTYTKLRANSTPISPRTRDSFSSPNKEAYIKRTTAASLEDGQQDTSVQGELSPSITTMDPSGNVSSPVESAYEEMTDMEARRGSESSVSETEEVNWEELAKTEEQEPRNESSDDSTALLLARLEQENNLLATNPKSGIAKVQVIEIVPPPPMTDYEFWAALVQDYTRTAQCLPTLLSKKIRGGIPQPIRGLVWQSMSGARNRILEDQYERLCGESSPYEGLIGKDLGRSFPGVEMFREPDGEGQRMLGRVLKCFSLYDSKIGYCQGLGLIVGPLLMHMGDKEAFCVLVRLVWTTYLSAHLDLLQIDPSYVSQWFLSFFAVTCPLPMLFRIYDVLFAEGASETLMRVALSLMRKNEQKILACQEIEDVMTVLLNRGLWSVYHYDADEFVNDFVSLTGVVTHESLQALENRFKAGGAVDNAIPSEASQSWFNRTHTTYATSISRDSSNADGASIRAQSVLANSSKSNKDRNLHSQIEDLLTALSEMQRDHAILATQLQREREARDEDRQAVKSLLDGLRKKASSETVNTESTVKATEESSEDVVEVQNLEEGSEISLASPTSVGETSSRDSVSSVSTLPSPQDLSVLLDIVEERFGAPQLNRTSSLMQSKSELRTELSRMKERLAIEMSKPEELTRQIMEQAQKISEQAQVISNLKDQVKESHVHTRNAHAEKQRLEKQIHVLKSKQGTATTPDGSKDMETTSPKPEVDNDVLLLELVQAKTAEAVAKQEAEEAKAKLESLRKLLNLNASSAAAERPALHRANTSVTSLGGYMPKIVATPEKPAANAAAAAPATGGFWGWKRAFAKFIALAPNQPRHRHPGFGPVLRRVASEQKMDSTKSSRKPKWLSKLSKLLRRNKGALSRAQRASTQSAIPSWKPTAVEALLKEVTSALDDVFGPTKRRTIVIPVAQKKTDAVTGVVGKQSLAPADESQATERSQDFSKLEIPSAPPQSSALLGQDDKATETAKIASRLEVMKSKQWTFQWDRRSVAVWDQAERIVKFVQTFQTLGTGIAQLDPIHAGIPWAGVCALLNSTPTRTFSNITKSVDWAELISTVKQTDADCVALTSVTATTNMSSDISLINKGVLRLDEKWTEISHIVETLGTLQKGFEAKQSENARILSWISDIRVGDIHRQKHLQESTVSTVIVIDGVDECIAVKDVFEDIITIRSDLTKTNDDIMKYIERELARKERRNAKVISDRLADRMCPVCFIVLKEYFVRMLDSLDAGHGIGALEALRDTYDAIYERNIQGPYNEDEAIEGGLILELCSNFLVVDAHGCILLPHLSVREYLEAKIVGGTWSMPCVNLDGEDGGADAVLGLRVDLDLIRDWPIISPEGLEKSLARRQTEIEMITSKFELHATYSWAPSFGAWAAGLFNVVKVGAIREASNTEKTVRKERSHNFWGGGFISAVVFVQSNTTCTAKLSGLLIACQYGFTEILKVDSKHGEAQVMLNHEEYPGLLLACDADRLEATNLLLNEDDLEVHARRSDGKTALQISYPGTKVQEALRKDWRYLPSDEKHAEGDPRGIVEEERKARIKEYWEEFRARFRN
ncbi:putative Ecotropic viral integration site 5 protein like protein [Glarea lozoyensis 74030]|uniref:Putative Ecotropic viral integration site 5 protein like protein n=1 Tax=Glarea lozoyensis (strain ATCC 74030 / MF5533) TaxID=1104152 RepID=H0EPW8_GLAL7|nr:putative Ecotropic viral integration site 5 protein like protein [Glarea lozoyensis 74030]